VELSGHLFRLGTVRFFTGLSMAGVLPGLARVWFLAGPGRARLFTFLGVVRI